MKNVQAASLLKTLGTLLIFAVVLTAPPIQAEARTLHALLIIMDADRTLSEQSQVNQQRIEKFLNNVEASLAYKKVDCNVRIDHLLSSANVPEKEATADNISNWLQNVRPAHDDIVFVYYTGHGKADTEGEKELYLLLPQSKFYRDKLVDAMDRLPCRLKILITENCSSGPRVSASKNLEIQLQKFDVNKIVESPDIGDTFTHLFIQHKGFLDLTSASEGELSLGDNTEGGWFTLVFVKVICRSYNLDQSPQDGFVSWEEVFAASHIRTVALFNRYIQRSNDQRHNDVRWRMRRIGQTTQHPKYFGELPKRITQ